MKQPQWQWQYWQLKASWSRLTEWRK